MAQGSGIEWTHATWNPVTGCTKVSPGCKHCYAERFSKRLQHMGMEKYRNGFRISLHPDSLSDPLRWRSPRMIFVNSMSDLFHPDIEAAFVRQVFDVMVQAHWHIFQVLTKRPEVALSLADKLPWPHNVWLGTSVENRDYIHRIRTLQAVPARLRFLSLEPLLGPLGQFPLKGIHWVIVGGESGPGARLMKPQWVESIRDRCEVRGVPFFFKQWGGVNKKKTGREIGGRTWDDQPAIPMPKELLHA